MCSHKSEISLKRPILLRIGETWSELLYDIITLLKAIIQYYCSLLDSLKSLRYGMHTRFLLNVGAITVCKRRPPLLRTPMSVKKK